MEKFAYKIERLLEETLFLYKELQTILEREKKHIVDMDVDSLWKTSAQKNKIAMELKVLHKKLLAFMEKRAVELSMDSSGVNLSDFIRKLPVPGSLKSNLRKIKFALDDCKKRVSILATANKKYIGEVLVVINDVFSMVAETVDQKQYNNSGNLSANKEKNHLINAEI